MIRITKKKTNWLWKIFCLLFLIFIALYIALESGYYETRMSKRTTLTQENIKKFEKDIKDGKAIDIDDYVVDENIDYSNTLTKAGNDLNEVIKKVFGGGLKESGKFLKSLFS